MGYDARQHGRRAGRRSGPPGDGAALDGRRARPGSLLVHGRRVRRPGSGAQIGGRAGRRWILALFRADLAWSQSGARARIPLGNGAATRLRKKPILYPGDFVCFIASMGPQLGCGMPVRNVPKSVGGQGGQNGGFCFGRFLPSLSPIAFTTLAEHLLIHLTLSAS